MLSTFLDKFIKFWPGVQRFVLDTIRYYLLFEQTQDMHSEMKMLHTSAICSREKMLLL